MTNLVAIAENNGVDYVVRLPLPAWYERERHPALKLAAFVAAAAIDSEDPSEHEHDAAGLVGVKDGTKVLESILPRIPRKVVLVSVAAADG